MTTATYTQAYTTTHSYACPAGHMEPVGGPPRMIVPDGLELAPACPACRRPLTRSGGPARGSLARVDECCTPAGEAPAGLRIVTGRLVAAQAPWPRSPSPCVGRTSIRRMP
jgi:hypothetical protein